MGNKAILYSVAESGICGDLKQVKQMNWIEFLDVYDYLYISGKFKTMINENK